MRWLNIPVNINAPPLVEAAQATTSGCNANLIVQKLVSTAIPPYVSVPQRKLDVRTAASINQKYFGLLLSAITLVLLNSNRLVSQKIGK